MHGERSGYQRLSWREQRDEMTSDKLLKIKGTLPQNNSDVEVDVTEADAFV